MAIGEGDVGTLFESEHDSLVRKMQRIVKDRFDAEDVAQLAYIKLIEKIRSGYEIEHGRAFLFRVATNLAIDHYRKSKIESARLASYSFATLDPDQSQTELDQEIEAVTSTDPRIEACLDATQRVADVQASLTSLTPKCRRVFQVHKFGELSYKQTAETLGISVSMVEKYMSQALTHVRQATSV
ncbi:MAG: RNA polymerase sigma factor [Gammaproteobacteria bacterium]|nr:RNA polymerase sigma factor [Gammaproteobacteria bacterium]MYH16598.1 RNA polymerase sigma factor [Gammaproteobacteria bacterium]